MSNGLMRQRLLKTTLLLPLVFQLCISLNAQTNKTSFDQVLIEIQDEEKQLAECSQKIRRISNFCYEFCPVRLAKPLYSNEARRMKISGLVKISVIVNEEGKVIYARILEGKPIISQSARRAAYRSVFKPRRNCENKLIKFRGTIVYNFH